MMYSLMKRRLTLLLAALGSTAMLASSATACDGLGGYGGIGAGFLYQSLENRVPYFAAHPPVYYSGPVARPYGYSPFAYPPNVMTPEIVNEMGPQMIVNPYVPSSRSTTPNKSKMDKNDPTGDQLTSHSGSQPLVVHNPYVSPHAGNVLQVVHSSR